VDNKDLQADNKDLQVDNKVDNMAEADNNPHKMKNYLSIKLEAMVLDHHCLDFVAEVDYNKGYNMVVYKVDHKENCYYIYCTFIYYNKLNISIKGIN
jgi:hypothetical protein